MYCGWGVWQGRGGEGGRPLRSSHGPRLTFIDVPIGILCSSWALGALIGGSNSIVDTAAGEPVTTTYVARASSSSDDTVYLRAFVRGAGGSVGGALKGISPPSRPFSRLHLRPPSSVPALPLPRLFRPSPIDKPLVPPRRGHSPPAAVHRRGNRPHRRAQLDGDGLRERLLQAKKRGLPPPHESILVVVTTRPPSWPSRSCHPLRAGGRGGERAGVRGGARCERSEGLVVGHTQPPTHCSRRTRLNPRSLRELTKALQWPHHRVGVAGEWLRNTSRMMLFDNSPPPLRPWCRSRAPIGAPRPRGVVRSDRSQSERHNPPQMRPRGSTERSRKVL